MNQTTKSLGMNFAKFSINTYPPFNLPVIDAKSHSFIGFECYSIYDFT